MAFSQQVVLERIVQLSNRSYGLTFQADAPFIEACRPGQFVMLSSDYFLNRPYGLLSIDREHRQFELGIDVVGKGSYAHAHLLPGAELTVIGPLGHGFDLSGNGPLILIGGGSGIYPLLTVAEEEGRRRDLRVSLGFRHAGLAVLKDRFQASGARVIMASDSGDLDFHGHAVAAAAECFQDILAEATFLACGPLLMLRAAHQLSQKWQRPCQVSFEERMACGVGFCSGCAVPMREGLPQRCCYEGPVFDSTLIDWEAYHV